MSARLKPILQCPWCKSFKIMAEGTDRRIAMVCQGCLARGPEIDAALGRDVALREWNERSRGKFSIVYCPTCGVRTRVSGCGIWPHRDWKNSRPCPSSGQKHEIQTA